MRRRITPPRACALRDLDAAALTLAQIGDFVLIDIKDDALLRRSRDDLIAELGAETVQEAIARARRLARPPDDRHYQELCASWNRVRKLFAGLLNRMEFSAAPGAEPVCEALAFLANTSDWARSSMRTAPTGCVSAPWSRHVFADGVKRPGASVADNRAYVFAVLEAARKALKRRDIFVAESGRFANPNRGMLDGAAWSAARPAILRALGRSENAQAEITALTGRLDAAYRRAIANLPGNPDLRFDDDGLVLSRLDKLEEPPGLVTLRRDIHAWLPKGDLPDILLEVFARTGLAGAFTHLTDQRARVDDFETSLAAVLIAEGCNIGFDPMIRPELPALRRDRLSWINQNFIRDETLREANARLVGPPS